MTEFDEEKLRRALRDAADGFAISDGATERILDEARDSGDAEAPSRIRSFVDHTGRMRSTVMAAAACVVVFAVAVPLFNSEVTPKSPTAVHSADFGVAGEVSPNKSLSAVATSQGSRHQWNRRRRHDGVVHRPQLQRVEDGEQVHE